MQYKQWSFNINERRHLCKNCPCEIFLKDECELYKKFKNERILQLQFLVWSFRANLKPFSFAMYSLNSLKPLPIFLHSTSYGSFVTLNCRYSFRANFFQELVFVKFQAVIFLFWSYFLFFRRLFYWMKLRSAKHFHGWKGFSRLVFSLPRTISNNLNLS